MKKIIFTLLVFVSLQSVAQNNGFVINGELRGAKANGKKIWIQIFDKEIGDIKPIDSTIVKNGKFVLKGTVTHPQRAVLTIDNTPAGKQKDESYFLQEDFFIENSNISFSGNIDSLNSLFWNPAKKTREPLITGSHAEEVNKIYKNEVRILRTEKDTLDEKYLAEYHVPIMSGKFNTKRGIEITRQIKDVKAKLFEKTMAFIEKYNNTAPAYEQAVYLLGEHDISTATIDKLESLITKGFEGTEEAAEFKKTADVARNYAIGTPYKDYTLQTPDGKTVKVSELIKPGKITMLEFWASWCSPCRGEIPHIKHLKKGYGDNFHVISISLDDSKANWKKALKEEKMTWPQANDSKAFEGEYAKTYNIQGIPYSLVLDGQGKIIQVNLRGAELDMLLEDMKIPKAAPETVPVKKK